jgi:hypothetical protein
MMLDPQHAASPVYACGTRMRKHSEISRLLQLQSAMANQRWDLVSVSLNMVLPILWTKFLHFRVLFVFIWAQAVLMRWVSSYQRRKIVYRTPL